MAGMMAQGNVAMDNVLTSPTRCFAGVLRSNVRFALVALGWIVVLSGGTVVAQRSGSSGGQTNLVTTNACIQPPASLAHWWTGDGSALDLPGGSHGTTRGKVAYASGKVAEAFSFDGTNGVVAASVPFNRVDGWALAAWVYWKGPSQDAAQKGEAIFYQGNPGKDGYGLFIIGGGWCSDFRELCFRAGELGILYGGVHWYFPELKLQQNTWVHLGLARSGGLMNVYYNGVLAWSKPGLSPIAPTSAFAISMEQPFTFNGLIDEVTAFSSPLDDGELGGIARADRCRDDADLVPLQSGQSVRGNACGRGGA